MTSNTITISSAGSPDVLVAGNDLLVATILHARSLPAMIDGDILTFTAASETHAVDATITAEGGKQPRVNMAFRELVDRGVQEQPGIGVKLVNAVSGS